MTKVGILRLYIQHLGSVTGDELEALQLDATMNASLNTSSRASPDDVDDAASNSSVENALLNYLTAFAKTG